MDGKLCRVICPKCGFVDYVNEEQWNGNKGVGGGVWAFKWWNGTDKDEPCLCPKCSGVICGGNSSPKLESDDFGILVVMYEEAIEKEVAVMQTLQAAQDGFGEPLDTEGFRQVAKG